MFEDSSVSDFVVLRNTLLISHLHDLKDYTHEILYERYRTEALSGESVPFARSTANAGADMNYVASPALSTPSKSIHSNADQAQSNPPQDTYLAREEQIRLEEERLRAFEERVQQELIFKEKNC